MNTEPLVSLLVANYNNAEFIVTTLDSAISQTYSNIEIVILDDASTDASVEIIEQYISDHRDFKIAFYKSSSNAGCGGAKRRCIDLAHGDYFAFLDPEDTIEPDAVELLLNKHLSGSGYSIVYCTHYLCNEKLEPQSVSGWPGKIPEGQSHLTSDGGHISAFALCKKLYYDKTQGIDPEFVVAEDQDLYFKLEEVAPVLYVDIPLYYYRKHDHNISWSDSKRYRNLYWQHKAKTAAYQRRKKGKTAAVNLTYTQLHRINFAFYMQYAKMYRANKQYFKSVIYSIKAITYLYTFFLNKK